MSAMASQITGVSIVYSTVCSGAVQRKHQSSAALAFVKGIHRWPVDSPRKGPVTGKMFPFDDVIMVSEIHGMRSPLEATAAATALQTSTAGAAMFTMVVRVMTRRAWVGRRRFYHRRVHRSAHVCALIVICHRWGLIHRGGGHIATATATAAAPFLFAVSTQATQSYQASEHAA